MSDATGPNPTRNRTGGNRQKATKAKPAAATIDDIPFTSPTKEACAVFEAGVRSLPTQLRKVARKYGNSLLTHFSKIRSHIERHAKLATPGYVPTSVKLKVYPQALKQVKEQQLFKDSVLELDESTRSYQENVRVIFKRIADADLGVLYSECNFMAVFTTIYLAELFILMHNGGPIAKKSVIRSLTATVFQPNGRLIKYLHATDGTVDATTFFGILDHAMIAAAAKDEATTDDEVIDMTDDEVEANVDDVATNSTGSDNRPATDTNGTPVASEVTTEDASGLTQALVTFVEPHVEDSVSSISNGTSGDAIERIAAQTAIQIQKSAAALVQKLFSPTKETDSTEQRAGSLPPSPDPAFAAALASIDLLNAEAAVKTMTVSTKATNVVLPPPPTKVKQPTGKPPYGLNSVEAALKFPANSSVKRKYTKSVGATTLPGGYKKARALLTAMTSKVAQETSDTTKDTSTATISTESAEGSVSEQGTKETAPLVTTTTVDGSTLATEAATLAAKEATTATTEKTSTTKTTTTSTTATQSKAAATSVSTPTPTPILKTPRYSTNDKSQDVTRAPDSGRRRTITFSSPNAVLLNNTANTNADADAGTASANIENTKLSPDLLFLGMDRVKEFEMYCLGIIGAPQDTYSTTVTDNGINLATKVASERMLKTGATTVMATAIQTTQPTTETHLDGMIAASTKRANQSSKSLIEHLKREQKKLAAELDRLKKIGASTNDNTPGTSQKNSQRGAQPSASVKHKKGSKTKRAANESPNESANQTADQAPARKKRRTGKSQVKKAQAAGTGNAKGSGSTKQNNAVKQSKKKSKNSKRHSNGNSK
jgi:hypothetical protein